jgi:hypothetical protein
LALAELVDCLLTRPNAVTHINLIANKLTDETGIKLAQYVASSTTIKVLALSKNYIGSATFLALAAALRVNTSLRSLYMRNRRALRDTHIDMAFVEALRHNPNRPAESLWWLHTRKCNDFTRLKCTASTLGPPSMLLQLRRCDRDQKLKTHRPHPLLE